MVLSGHYGRIFLRKLPQGYSRRRDDALYEQDAGSFLGIGSMDMYRRDNYLTKIFNKWGSSQTDYAEKTNLAYKVHQVLESRIAAYQLPERSTGQKKLLQQYLPSQCQY